MHLYIRLQILHTNHRQCALNECSPCYEQYVHALVSKAELGMSELIAHPIVGRHMGKFRRGSAFEAAAQVLYRDVRA